MQESKKIVESFNQSYRLLSNWVDERNTMHTKWLSRFGFVFINRVEEFGYEGRPFYEFVRTEAHNV